MPYINSTQFGNVVIDNKKYNQVLIVGDSVMERDYDKLKELFGTSHKIGDWEIKELLKQAPEIIIIGTGQSGAMKVDKEVIDNFKNKDIEIITDITPKAIEIYNQKTKQGKRVNALIHTTC
jgi:hypothetical protein